MMKIGIWTHNSSSFTFCTFSGSNMLLEKMVFEFFLFLKEKYEVLWWVLWFSVEMLVVHQLDGFSEEK